MHMREMGEKKMLTVGNFGADNDHKSAFAKRGPVKVTEKDPFRYL